MNKLHNDSTKQARLNCPNFQRWCACRRPVHFARSLLTSISAPMPRPIALLVQLAAACALLPGCGINKSRLATEQLVISDAVDKTVATIDFSPLSGKKVYFDTQYLDGVNMGPNGNVKYVVSSLRQQMMAYDLRLQEKSDTADFVIEG